MRKFTRATTPKILEDNWEQWGNEFAEKRNLDSVYKFNWKTITGSSVNHIILPTLKNQTDNHCSFCDKYPLDRGDNTIDHFKPKHNPLYYTLVYNWFNLYLACDACQGAKGIKYNDELLRPDDFTYSFNEYFDYNFTTHEILPNPNQSDSNINKASTTIETFDLNYDGLKTARRHAFEKYNGDDNPVISDYNFRFMFD